MTREYRHFMRTPRDTNPVVNEYPRAEVDRLVENFVQSVQDQPELLVEAYMAMSHLQLKELLLEELRTMPLSPVSQEMRRVVLVFARERAEVAARQILSGD